MKNARLTAIEFLDREWLDHWAVFFRSKASPWRIRDDQQQEAEPRRTFLEQALRALEAMRARPGPTEEQRAVARALDAGAAVVTRFRVETEQGIQRSVLAEAKQKGWELAGAKDLPPLPPFGEEIQRWFLDSPTKAAFLAKAAAEWKGDLGELYLPHWVGDERSSTSVATDLLEIRDHWSDATYARWRAKTIETVGR
jgi:hypothetical protein